MKQFTTKIDVLQYLEDGMGSTGSREQAEQMYDLLRQTGKIIIDWDGIYMQELQDGAFLAAWDSSASL